MNVPKNTRGDNLIKSMINLWWLGSYY